MERPVLVIGYPIGDHDPVDPGYGRPGHSPVDPGFGVGRPPHINNGLPWLGGGHIDNSLPIPPAPPTTKPPTQIWPPVAPIFPAGPDNELPPAGSIWPPLPPVASGENLLVLVYITGLGWHWTVIDPSLSAGYPLPPAPEPK